MGAQGTPGTTRPCSGDVEALHQLDTKAHSTCQPQRLVQQTVIAAPEGKRPARSCLGTCMPECPACINTRPSCTTLPGMQDGPPLCSKQHNAPWWSASRDRFMAAAVASEAAQQQAALKRTYSSMWIGEDLDDDYGVDTSSPPKDRRAGLTLVDLLIEYVKIATSQNMNKNKEHCHLVMSQSN